ncbi:unnamed protein product [Brassica rapa subsp. trilocularis]
MKGLKLQCSSFKPPFKIHANLPDLPFALYLDFYLNPHLFSPGPGDSTLQFRLLHFWEARKNVKGVPGIILGIEMLMIDAEVILHFSLY